MGLLPRRHQKSSRCNIFTLGDQVRHLGEQSFIVESFSNRSSCSKNSSGVVKWVRKPIKLLLSNDRRTARGNRNRKILYLVMKINLRLESDELNGLNYYILVKRKICFSVELLEKILI